MKFMFSTARRAGAAFLILIGLTGCLDGGGKSGSNLSDSPIFSASRATPKADLARQASVMGGAVKVAAPRGFCVDRSSLRQSKAGAFVPMGACAALTKNPADPKPAKPAFLTISVAPMPVQAAALPADSKARIREARAFFQTDTGRAALSRSGKASSVTVLDMKSTSNVLYVRLRDKSGGLPEALSDTTWRAFFEVNGQLVTASATGFTDTPLGQGKGYDLLRDLVKAVQKANPGS